MPPRTPLRRAILVAGCLASWQAGLIGPSRSAYAGTSLQAQITASAGVTDNVAGAPNDPLPGQKGRETDLVVSLNPSLILSAGSDRAVQRLQYTFGGLIYAANSDADTYTNTLTWNGFFIPSKRTLLGLNLAASQGRQSAFNTALDSSTTGTQAVPLGVTNILTINAAENLAWEVAKKWRLYQSLSFGTTYIIDTHPPQATTRSVPLIVGVERSLARDTLGIECNATYLDFPEIRGPATGSNGTIDSDGIVSPRQSQISVTPLARWRRDLSYFVSSRVEAGAVIVFDPDAPSSKLVEPAGGVGLNFFGRLVNLDISYAHGATPNLLFRSNFITDSGALRAQFILGERSGFSLLVTAGYSYQRQLDIFANVLAHVQNVAGDVTLAYAPHPIVNFFLRYQILYQLGRADDPMPLPDYYRNTLLFGINAIYPEVNPINVPNNTLGVRADRRDQPTITSSKSTQP